MNRDRIDTIMGQQLGVRFKKETCIPIFLKILFIKHQLIENNRI